VYFGYPNFGSKHSLIARSDPTAQLSSPLAYLHNTQQDEREERRGGKGKKWRK
jgi:hypothetical protein